MKYLIWFFLISSSVFANSFTLPSDAIRLSPLEDLDVLEIKSVSKKVCEKDCPFKKFVKIKLRFTLYGCEDELGPLSYKVKYRLEKMEYFLYLSAINIHRKASEEITCFLPKKQTVDILLNPNVNKDNLVISFLNFKGNKINKNYVGEVFVDENNEAKLKTEDGIINLKIPSHLKEEMNSYEGSQIEILGQKTIFNKGEKFIKIIDIRN